MPLDSTTSLTEIRPTPAPANPGAAGGFAVGALDWDDEARARMLVVQVGGNEYGLPVEQVRGVVRQEKLTRVPGTPDFVCGIVNVRGAVVTVLDLAVLLGTARAVTPSSIVLLEHGTRLIGISVDVVRDVRACDPPGSSDPAGAAVPQVALLDAVALCAPHLLSSEEMGL